MISSSRPTSPTQTQEELEIIYEETSEPEETSELRRGTMLNHKRPPVPTFNPEVRRKDFRKYLDKSGLMDSLTRVLVQLYEEKEPPKDVVEYIYDNLSGGPPIKMELSALLQEKAELTAKVKAIEKENDRLEALLESRVDNEFEGEEDHEGLFEEEGEAEAEEP